MPLWDSSKGDVHAIDGYPIGATTPSTGAFTTLTASAIVRGVATGLTASVTQTLAGGLALTKEINVVATSANSGDAVTLPAIAVGQSVIVFNEAATNAIKVFPADAAIAIDGGTAGASVTLSAGKRAQFTRLSDTVIISAQFGAKAA